MARINETRKRSLYKALSWRALEITLTTLVLHFFLGEQWHLAIGWACILECSCLLLHYGFERLWNRTDYGRDIVKEK